MQSISPMLMLLAQIVLCSSGKTNVTGMKPAEADKGNDRCGICHADPTYNPENNLHWVECPYDYQHIFHASCLATDFVTINAKEMKCPTCFGDCKPMMRNALANYQERDKTEFFPREMLERMNLVPERELDIFLDHMNFLSDEYKHMNQSFINTKFEQVKNAIESRIADSIYSSGALYKYLTLENITHIPADAYAIALTKYIASSTSMAQLLSILRNILKRRYCSNEEKRTNAKYFIDAFVLLPIQLPTNSVYEIVIELLKHRMAGSADIMLVNTRAVHNMEVRQVFHIIKRFLDINNENALKIAKRIWICNVYLRELKFGHVMLHMNEYLAELDTANADTMKAFYDKMDYPLSGKSVDVDKAIEIIKRIADEERQKPGVGRIISSMAEECVFHMLVNTSKERRKQVFKSMLSSLHAKKFMRIYMCLPEFMTDIEIDLHLLKWLIRNREAGQADVDGHFILLAQRPYFGYDMVLRILDVLSDAKPASKVGVMSCIRLLLSAKRQGFLDLDDKNAELLFKKLNKVKFFEGIAVLESHFEDNLAIKDAFRKGKGVIMQAIPLLSWHLQLYVMHCCTDTHIFAIWCENITHFVKNSLEEMAGNKKATAKMILSTISSLCESEHFTKYVSVTEVIKFTEMLLQHGSAALKYIDAFFVVARSPLHIYAAKMVLYKAYTMQSMTKEEIAAIAAIEFKIMREGPGYLVLDETKDMLLNKMIDGTNWQPLLKLVRDKMK